MLKRIALLCLVGILLLTSACGIQTNYEGTGNEFVIVATLDRVFKDDSVWVNDVKVEQASGRAVGWFTSEAGWLSIDQPHAEIHDNYKSGIWASKQNVGQVYNAEGKPRPLEGLPAGGQARLTGKIRSDTDGEDYYYRAVFDKLEILPM